MNIVARYIRLIMLGTGVLMSAMLIHQVGVSAAVDAATGMVFVSHLWWIWRAPHRNAVSVTMERAQ